jgi:hypothetical protein
VGEGSGVLSHGDQDRREALQRVVSRVDLIPTTTTTSSRARKAQER